jgi:hypothetical protein
MTNMSLFSGRRTLRSAFGDADVRTAFLLTFGLVVLVFATQGRLTVNGGQGWDGTAYTSMVDPTAKVSAPFNLRIGYPFLARHLAPFANPVDNFALLSALFGAAFAWVSYTFLRRRFPTAPRGALILAWSVLNLSELGPLRAGRWYPVHTDIPFNLVFLLLVMVLFGDWRWPRKSVAVALLFLLGTVTRENFVVNLALVALVQLTQVEGRRLWLILHPARLAPFAAALLGTALAALAVKAGSGDWILSSKSQTMLHWLQAMRFLPFVQAMIAVYGFLVLLRVGCWGWAPRWPPHGAACAVFLLLTIPIAITGGENYERFLFWYMPVVVYLAVPLVETLWQRRRRLELIAAFGHVFVVQRYYCPIDTLSSHALDAGCPMDKYLMGYSPNLMHYALICRVDHNLPFLAFFGICLLVVLLARTRISLREPASSIGTPLRAACRTTEPTGP